MSSVGLLFVGAVLFINGLLFLGKVDARSAGLQPAMWVFRSRAERQPPSSLSVTGIAGDRVPRQWRLWSELRVEPGSRERDPLPGTQLRRHW